MRVCDDSLVKNIFKVDRKYITKGVIGVEVEVEGSNLPAHVEGWRLEHDGSLREGIEYVFVKPMSVEQGMSTLDNLAVAFKENNSEVPESVRAGVHVHINVQDMDVVQLFTFITCYLVLEDTLIKYCGENRQGNLFCLRATDAQFLPFILHEVIRNKELYRLHHDDLRYASINLKALGEYGSLEFRAMRSTPDIEAIKTWVNMLLSIKEASTSFKNPKEVMYSMSMEGQREFAARCLGEYIGLVDSPLLGKEVSNCARNIQMVAFATDWEKFKLSFEEKLNPFEKAADVNKGVNRAGGWDKVIERGFNKVNGRPPVMNKPIFDWANVGVDIVKYNRKDFLNAKPLFDEDF